MNRTAPTDIPIHETLQKRWSPYAIDPKRMVNANDLRALFEAARWMMSSYNAQPWRYIVGTRDHSPEIWNQIFEVLLEGNQPWAQNAPVLALGIVQHYFEHNGELNKAAVHDLGAASAGLTMEAVSRGLAVHQMIGIDPDKARETFGLTDGLEPYTGLAIGYVGDASVIPENYAQRDQSPRQRKSLSEIILAGSID